MKTVPRLSACLAMVLVLALGWVSGVAQTTRVESIPSAPADAISPEVKAVLDGTGYRVRLADGWTADFWFVKELKGTVKDSPGALYPEISNAEFIGVVKLPKGMADFRGQAIPPGTYTLRYRYIPQDANHMGVSPNPDFLLAIPAANDPNPAANYLLPKLVSLSSKVTGAHPAVLAMDTAGDPGTITVDQTKTVVLTVAVKLAGGTSSEKLGIIIKGQATQ